MPHTSLILVDTCVLLVDPGVLVRIRQKGGLPVLTSTVLDELDYNKDFKKRAKRGDEERAAENAKNAQLIFREFNRSASAKLTTMPSGEPLLGQDVLTRFSFRDGPVFLVGRGDFRSVSDNDAKIIELAKDYRMILITRDNGMKVRAEALGVDVAFWTGPDDSNQRGPRGAGRQRSSNDSDPQQMRVELHQPQPFALCTAPLNEVDLPSQVGEIPVAGHKAKLGNGHEFFLGARISAGGEGSIYETQLSGHVCKIYHRNRLTKLKQRKVELMVSRKIDRPGICWPVEIVTNTTGDFVGYLMPRATGITMQTAMFVKPRLEKTFPKWSRRDLVNVAGTFLDHVSYLHGLNIIVGDINPLNLLVMEDSTKVWMVDTDSFQIEGFPCPVGTMNFTAPEIQGKNYSEFLRTKDHELFSIATMIFMILLPGKPPYSQQGGGSPAENIQSKNFPYRFYTESARENPEVSGKNAPQGTWQFIWANLPNSIREAFFNTFWNDKRTSIDEWTGLLLNYRDRIDRNDLTSEMFPLGFKVRDPVQIDCAKCSVGFTASQRWVEKMNFLGKAVWCPECANRVRVERLAAQSRRSTEQITGQTVGYGQGSLSGSLWPRSATPSGAGPSVTIKPKLPPRTHRINSPAAAGKPGPSSGYRANAPRPSANVKTGGILGSLLRFIFK